MYVCQYTYTINRLRSTCADIGLNHAEKIQHKNFTNLFSIGDFLLLRSDLLTINSSSTFQCVCECFGDLFRNYFVLYSFMCMFGAFDMYKSLQYCSVRLQLRRQNNAFPLRVPKLVAFPVEFVHLLKVHATSFSQRLCEFIKQTPAYHTYYRCSVSHNEHCMYSKHTHTNCRR